MFKQLGKKGSILTEHSNNKRNQKYLLRQRQRQYIIQQRTMLEEQKRYEKLNQPNSSEYNLEKEYYFKYPKKLHLYWDKSPLSFLNLLTVISFNRYHENWKIYIYTPKNKCNIISWNSREQKKKYKGRCYFNELLKIDNVFLKVIDLDKIGFYKEASEVIKSDYFRYYILYNEGGVWSDFDILFTSSIENKLNFKNNSIIFRHYNNKHKIVYYPVGLFISMQGTDFFKYILNSCKKFYNSKHYQSIGTKMFEKILGITSFNDSKKKLEEIDKNVGICTDNSIYLPLEWCDINYIYTNMNYTIPKQNIGIHWFNGGNSSKSYINKLDIRLDNFDISCFLDLLINDYISFYNKLKK